MNESTQKRLIPYIILPLITIVGSLFIYSVLSYPEKKPYRDAKAAYDTVYRSNVAFTQNGMSLNLAKASDSEFEANLQRALSSLDSLEKGVQKLGEYTVLTEGEGESLYEAFASQLDKYVSYNRDLLGSINELRPVLLSCNTAMTNLSQESESAAAMSRCAETLRAKSDEAVTPSADYRAMAVAFASVYEAIGAATSDDERGRFMEELSDVNNDFSRNLSESREKVDITATAKALDEYLSKKSRIL